jgi:L-iditol 2-dehydrogenase
MFTRLLALQGVAVLATDLMEPRLRMARRLGARSLARGDDPRLAGRVEHWTRGRGLDAAVLAVPSAALVGQAQAMVRGAGQVLLFANTRRGDVARLDLAAVCVDEKDLIGSYSSDLTLQAEVARLVFSRQLDVRPLITHQFPLAATAEAVRLAANPRPDSLKVVVSQVDA